jgi:hypothetical protein
VICWGKDCRPLEITKKDEVFHFNFDANPNVSGIVDLNGWVLKGMSNSK